jgi:hypothetical protein
LAGVPVLLTFPPPPPAALSVEPLILKFVPSTISEGGAPLPVALEPSKTELADTFCILAYVTLLLPMVVASAPEVVMSPERSPFVMDVAPENLVRLPIAGEPVVVTVPVPGADELSVPPLNVILLPIVTALQVLAALR